MIGSNFLCRVEKNKCHILLIDISLTFSIKNALDDSYRVEKNLENSEKGSDEFYYTKDHGTRIGVKF
jgi:hypothetical protein